MESRLDIGSPAHDEIEKNVVINQKLVQELNNGVHSVDDIRRIVGRIIDKKIDPTTEIRLPFYTDYGRNIHFGKNVFINLGVTFTDLGGIYIDDNVLIGPNSTIVSVNHRIESEQRRNLDLKSVHIHKNAWLGANVTVTPGIVIGENAIVGAGAVVTKDVPANTIVAGVPAKIIRKI